MLLFNISKIIFRLIDQVNNINIIANNTRMEEEMKLQMSIAVNDYFTQTYNDFTKKVKVLERKRKPQKSCNTNRNIKDGIISTNMQFSNSTQQPPKQEIIISKNELNKSLNSKYCI